MSDATGTGIVPAMSRSPSAAPSARGRDEHLMLGLLHAARALEDRIEDALAPVGLSFSKLGVLTQLVEAEAPLSLSDLAERLRCVRSNMTQLVDRLEADGLVERVDDPADRRSVRAAITPEGAARQHAGQSELARVRDEFINALEPDERLHLGRVLTALE